MPKLSAIKIYSVILLVLIGSFYFFYNKKNPSKEEVVISLRDYLLGSFISELPDINNKLPLKIDNKTTLLSISYYNNNIVSVYELAKFDNDLNSIEKIKSILSKQVCDDDTKKKLLDVDVDFLNRYQNQSGDIIFEVLLTRAICSKNWYDEKASHIDGLTGREGVVLENTCSD